MSQPSKIDVDVEAYKKNGYIIVENLLTHEEVEALKKEMLCICKGERAKIKGLQKHRPEDPEEEIFKHYLAIHFPHKISEIILHLLKDHSKTNQVLQQLIGPNVKTMQSILFIKSPGLPGQAWHQDEFYIPTRDRSLTATWIAIDDATVENGCLWVIPGSHRPGVLYPMRPHNDPRYDSADIAYGWEDLYDENRDAVPVELKAGSAVFFNGYLLHRSLENKSQRSFRRAFANHYMSAESLLPWNWDGRIPGYIEDNRDILMVTGKDPYAWKGTATYTYPFLRAIKRTSGAVFNEVVEE
jgi:phytanoyl-CoA hydroxylase